MSPRREIPFNKPYLTGKEFDYMREAAEAGQLSGDGAFTKSATDYLNKVFKGSSVLITSSCTAALEMSAILLDVGEGDEVICPSYTFVSTANAFALRGARIVFVDIDEASLCIDIEKVCNAITAKTKVVVAVHYAGISCDMDTLKDVCSRNKIKLVEDAAQGYDSWYKDKRLGQIGDIGTISFHETKNIISGEGGCIVLNTGEYKERAAIIREKGTDRSLFMEGLVDKYTWRDIGSSYLPGDMVAAFLLAQIEQSEMITAMRLRAWERYYENLSQFASSETFRVAQIPSYAKHNGHMFYLICKNQLERAKLLEHLRANSVKAVFHYVPLHDSPAGIRFGETRTGLDVTKRVSSSIVRLPLYPDISVGEIDYVSMMVKQFYGL